jgi:hypothetical protein
MERMRGLHANATLTARSAVSCFSPMALAVSMHAALLGLHRKSPMPDDRWLANDCTCWTPRSRGNETQPVTDTANKNSRTLITLSQARA